MENLTRENAVKDDFFVGDIDSCIDYLTKCRQEGKSVWIEFRGQKLYSCDATVNGIYMQVFGKTKEEFEQDEKEFFEGLQKKKTKERSELAEKKPEWIEAGSKLIYPERMKEWEKCVDISMNGLYEGSELVNAITVMEMLNSGTSFENVQIYLKGLKTSGSSASVIENIILNFSKKGPEFFEYMRGGPEKIDENTRAMIEKIRGENREYEANEIITARGPEWRKKAASFIYPERMEEWERIMRLRVKERFKGADLDLALSAMELLDKGLSFEKVEKYIEDKSKTISGASMAENIVLSFSKKGPDFFESVRPNDAKELVAQLRDINAKLAERHKNDKSKQEEPKKGKTPREQLTSLAAQKRSLEAELESVEAELSDARKQEDKTSGQEIGEN